MRNLFQTIFVGFVLSGCGGSSNSSSNTDVDAGRIVGAWEYIYSNYSDAQCLDLTIFRGDGTFRVEARDEIQTGEYSFSTPTDGTARYVVEITFETDNQLADCDGETSNEAGLEALFYVEFPSDEVMSMYENVSGGSVIGSFNRRS